MKKSITKLMVMVAFLTMGSMTYAQCTGSVYIKNTSNDDWIVSYYNQDIVVAAQSDENLGYFNMSPQIGRGVLLDSNPNDCNHKFQNNPDTWFPACTSGTNVVYYQATLDANGCYNNGMIYIF